MTAAHAHEASAENRRVQRAAGRVHVTAAHAHCARLVNSLSAVENLERQSVRVSESGETSNRC